MAILRNEPEELLRLDWSLLEDSASTLYVQSEFINEDAEWLRAHNYRIDTFHCTLWTTEKIMLKELAAHFGSPDYEGCDLDMLKDWLWNLEIPEEGGRVLVFLRFDAFLKMFPNAAWSILEYVEMSSRRMLLFGRRLLALVQSDDPNISLKPVGARQPMWNSHEWALYESFGQ